MNKQRLLEMADWLDAGAPHKYVKFDMLEYIRPHLIDPDRPSYKGNICGTAACIAGSAVIFYAPELFHDDTNVFCINYFREAANILGLSDSQAWGLFQGQNQNLQDITPKWAGKVVRHLAETGEVDWAKFQP